MFSDSDSEAGEDFKLTINEHYAKAFEYKKEREELEKLKAKYGSDAEENEDEEESDSESDESEDEDGEELTPAIDAAILRTLARIKRKDPEIYNSKSVIFQEEQTRVGSVQPRVKQHKDKSKPITIRQVALEAALDTTSRSPSPVPLTHAEEQKRLRDETIAAFHGNGDEEEGDDFLIPREKTKDELDREEEEYREFLQREVGNDLNDLVTVDPNAIKWDTEEDTARGDKKDKKKKKSKAGTNDKAQSKEDADQEFLMNYIMNRGWIDRSIKRVPTYKEITSTSITDKGKGRQIDEEDSDSHTGDEEAERRIEDADVDEDDFDEIVDRFESSYNFRFEEPDGAEIKQYPRNIESTVRREESTRKEARQRKKQRKEEELQKRTEEVKRMKALKMKELRARLEKIGKEGGKNIEHDPALQDLDLEGDWDPDAHDKQMEGLYGDDAEFNEPDGKYDEDGKPIWDDDIDIGDIYFSDDDQAHGSSSKKDKKKKKKKNGNKAEEDGVNVEDMDADVQKVDDDEEWDGTEEMRKRKMEEYMDEIYGLDFNDMVGGLPTRFQYTKVKPEAFALTPVEILLATDKDLNEYMSIKKYAPYRNDAKWDAKRNERLKELKAKIAKRRNGEAESDPTGIHGVAQAQGERPAKKRKGKKERMKMKVLAESEGAGEELEAGPGKRKRTPEWHGEDEVEKVDTGGDESKKKKKRRRHRKKESEASNS
ncbi:Kinetochore protein Spc24 [Paramarasmius palmivorus]|uniref:Kinetochore protein Spc24 n=1 Tax=Paramarasmius palmivorus TaxID=297713 RepID=A0AAW0DKX9_9AGAR